MKTKTYNQGANDERSAIIAKVRRSLRQVAYGVQLDGRTFLEWLLNRNERYNKRKGGLGK